MKEIVYDIIIGAVVLSLLFTILSLFKGNINLIGAGANKNNDMRKVDSSAITPVSLSENGKYTGADVVGEINYWSKEYNVDKVTYAESLKKQVKVELTKDAGDYKDALSETFNDANQSFDIVNVNTADISNNSKKYKVIYDDVSVPPSIKFTITQD